MTFEPSLGSFPFAAPRRWRALAGFSAVIIVALLSAIPVVPSTDPAASTAIAGHSATPVPAPTPSISPPALPRGNLPGADPVGSPFLNVPTWVQSHPFLGSERSSPARSNASSGSPSGKPASFPPAGLSGRGRVVGTVVDVTTRHPIALVFVQAVPVNGSGCPSNLNCTATSNATGGFLLDAPVGLNLVSFTPPISGNVSEYLENQTLVHVTTNVTDLGNVYLVHVGYATGTIIADRPGTPPLGNVSIQATSRDGAILFGTVGASAPNGTFTVPVPPLPTRLDFSLAGYANETLFVNASPWAVAPIGTVRMIGGIHVELNLTDSVTKQPAASSYAELCSARATSMCSRTEASNANGTIDFVWIPGATTVRAGGTGYELNKSPIESIPDLPAGRTFFAGDVELVPMGLVNFTVEYAGGPAPNLTWTPPVLWIFVCSLSGGLWTLQLPSGQLGQLPCTLYANLSFGKPVELPSVALRVVLWIVAFEGTFPIDTIQLPPPLPNIHEVPVANFSWANVTPDQVDHLGVVNVTTGGYVTGRFSSPSGVTITNASGTGCSVRESICNAGGGYVPGCLNASNAFCIAAPSGPDVITVKPANTTLTRPIENFTWTNVPYGCCHQEDTAVNVGWVNLSLAAGGVAEIHGLIRLDIPGTNRTAPPGSEFTTLSVCPVEGEPGVNGSLPCVLGYANNTTGGFNLTVPGGWDNVLVVAGGHQSNSTWVYANGTNDTGTIILQADAEVYGTVTGSNGIPLYEAVVTGCTVSPPQVCPAITTTSSSGLYQLQLPGAPFPAGAYEIVAQASGFVTNYTWINATAGSTIFVPPIALAPIGAQASPLPRAAQPGGAWFTGRAVDADTGFGIPEATVTLCPTAGGGCLTSGAITTFEGSFNVSAVSGRYTLELTAVGYVGRSVYANLSGAGTLEIGAVTLTPYPWVSGRVLIDPWESLNGSVGLGESGATARVCDATGMLCGRIAPVASGGEFNVSAPPGSNDQLLIEGGGIGGSDSALGGFDNLLLTFNASGQFQTLVPPTPGGLRAPIFAAFVGEVGDLGSYNATYGNPTRTVPLVPALGTPSPASLNPATGWTGGGGGFTYFLSASASQLILSNLDIGFVGANDTLSGPFQPGATYAVPEIGLPPYGFVTAHLRLLPGGAAAPFANLFTNFYDAVNRSSDLVASSSNGAGDVNVSAWPGNVNFEVKDPAYSTYSALVLVHSGVPTSLRNIGLYSNTTYGPWWVRSEQVSTVGVPPTPTIVDQLTGAVVVHARLAVVGANLSAQSVGVNANDLGQFLMTASEGTNSSLYVVAPGYESNHTPVYAPAGGTVTFPTINLTGFGIVAGQVLSQPGNRPVPNLTVDVCLPTQNGCGFFGTTNGAGEFWVAAPPGQRLVEPQTDLYLANETRAVNVVSDAWVWSGNVTVYAFSLIRGTVIGLPIGLPLAGANVSFCVPIGPPPGACLGSVNADVNGTFEITSIPGRFNLAVTYPGYNSTYRPLDVPPGTTFEVGIITLQQFGLLQGKVENATGHAPIAGASLVACALGNSNACSGFVNTTANGSYDLAAPPGTDAVTVVAVGYNYAVVNVNVPSGEVATAPTIYLLPVGIPIPQSVSGRVVDAASPLLGVPGALVTVQTPGGSDVKATTADSSGAFSLSVYPGVYYLVARESGWTSDRQLVTVSGPVSGIILTLSTFTYPVTGTIYSTLGGAVAGALVRVSSVASATSNTFGQYALALPNGTYTLTATPPNGSNLAPVAVALTVSGGRVARDLTLPVAGGTLSGVVVDAGSGLPVRGATVIVSGRGIPSAVTSAVDNLGGFSLALPDGAYSLRVSAPGYASVAETVNLTSSSPPITVALTPVLAPSKSGTPIWELGAIAAAAIALGVGIYLVVRLRRPPALALVPSASHGLSRPPAEGRSYAADEPPLSGETLDGESTDLT